jgi:serine/threonine protein kinase
VTGDLTGRTIAKYRVTAKLGEGGMGQVYRATDTKLKGDEAIACPSLVSLEASAARPPSASIHFWPRFEAIRASSVFSTG